MTKYEENIIIPRWFLENIENTLRIQNNINLDKKGGETCQDRNIKEALNGVRKLLRGKELTGGERLEKLQPSLSSNLDEAANDGWALYEYRESPRGLYSTCYIDGFKAGAGWLAGQGEIHELIVESPVLGPPMICCSVNANNGDKVIVQIKKK